MTSVIGLGHLWPHLILMTFLKALSPNIVILGIRASIYEFGVHGILQARGILGWVAISPPAGDIPNPGIELLSPAWAGGFFTAPGTP